MSETFEFRGYHLPVRLALMTGGGADTFQAISDWHQDLLRTHIDLKPTDNVLELGCGIGRDAIPLSQTMTRGSYVGIDIIGESIRWCRENIGAKHSNFNFIHFDVKDDLHNPGGVLANSEIAFPVLDKSIDKIFLFSVFTHMMSIDIKHYMREFSRIIRDDGLIYATTFVYDEEILAAARRTNLTPFDLRFEHEIEEGCRINNPDAPLGAVAYTRAAWDGMIAGSGLQYAGPILTGAWSGFYPDPQEGQDVLILKPET